MPIVKCYKDKCFCHPFIHHVYKLWTYKWARRKKENRQDQTRQGERVCKWKGLLFALLGAYQTCSKWAAYLILWLELLTALRTNPLTTWMRGNVAISQLDCQFLYHHYVCSTSVAECSIITLRQTSRKHYSYPGASYCKPTKYDYEPR